MKQLETFQASPQAQTSRLLDFERAEVRTLESYPPRYMLIVEGTKPCLNMTVDLTPLIYVQQPEYWGVEVIGTLRGGLCLPALASYAADLLDPPVGTKGIEVIGATMRERIDFPPGESPRGTFALSITSKRTGAIRAKATLTCGPVGGTHPHAEAACRQLSDVSGCIDEIAADEGPCTREFDPVVLRASGSWDGEDRRFEGEYPNPCVGIRATGGHVFDFLSE
jgi:hypothetical protein